MLKDVKIEKLCKRGYTNLEQFRRISDYIVEQYVSTPAAGGANLTKEARVVISDCSAVDMAIGAAFKRNKYILIGVIIGVTGVGAIITTNIIINRFKQLERA